MDSGQKLWQRAKQLIPGGTMLLSKRPEMFLPEGWPTYYSRSAGCTIWDLDGRAYTDMSLMGVGTNTLGYANPNVDNAVRATIDAGNLTTLNCPEEVYLAERLVALHPWSDMVRFARTGGEANAIAIRIARAATGKDKIAICGYHGWHDWYLATNIESPDALTTHLLPGLEPSGVPAGLQGTVIPFRYNDLDALESILEDDEVGVVKMEVSRSSPPKPGFLEGVRELTERKAAVLIFDECTSGFRQTLGGLHKAYGVDPDMAVFGKTLGNGYAITAVIGRDRVMESAQDTFISSTFWTERIGPTAALATLDVMEQTKSYDVITKIGNTIRDGWRSMANDLRLTIEVSGLPALSTFKIPSSEWLKYRTLITQEMLLKGYLATNSIYVSTSHTSDVVHGYFEAIGPIFELIKDCETGRTSVDDLLSGPIAHTTFERLN